MARLWTALLMAACLGGISGLAQAGDDEKQLAGLLHEWIAARNAHDIARMRPLFDERMDHVQLASGVSNDREGMLKWFEEAFRGSGKGITARLPGQKTQKIRVLSPDAAIIDFAVDFVAASGGNVEGRSNITFVCINRASEWKIAAVRFAPAVAKSP